MQINIRLAEPFWQPVGMRDLQLNLGEGACVSDLLARLREEYPALAKEMDQTPPNIFIEETEAHADSFLSEGDRVHLVWPIAGG